MRDPDTPPNRFLASKMRSVSLDFLHRRSENTHVKLKTRVPEPFWTFERSFFMHRRSENERCAQARCFCKTVQNHRACQRKSLVCKLVKNSRENAKSAQESAHSSRGLAVIFPLCAPPAAEGQKRQLQPFSGTMSGTCSATSRTAPGSSRTAPGRLADPFRTICSLSRVADYKHVFVFHGRSKNGLSTKVRFLLFIP